MDVKILEDHIKEIEEAIQKSAASHNALIGRLEGVRHILDKINADKEQEALQTE